MDGRFHLYEGYSPQQISFPIRVLRALGTKTLVVSNAAGGLNPNFQAGDLMVITDHINFTGQNPLVGPNVDEWGLRFPDMIEPYSRRLVDLAEQTALNEGIALRRGVYAGVLGPCLETAAETRFLRMSGGGCRGHVHDHGSHNGSPRRHGGSGNIGNNQRQPARLLQACGGRANHRNRKSFRENPQQAF